MSYNLATLMSNLFPPSGEVVACHDKKDFTRDKDYFANNPNNARYPQVTTS